MPRRSRRMYPVIAHLLSSQIDRRNLFALMPELARNDETRLVVAGRLLWSQLPCDRAASGRARKARDLLETLLRIVVAVSVDFVNAGFLALMSESIQLLLVSHIHRNQAVLAEERLGFME